MRQRNARCDFDVRDWREIFTLFPDQWLALHITGTWVSPDNRCMGMRGFVISSGDSEEDVDRELCGFRKLHPTETFAVWYTGEPSEELDIIL
jgi:hypothetical protein